MTGLFWINKTPLPIGTVPTDTLIVSIQSTNDPQGRVWLNFYGSMVAINPANGQLTTVPAGTPGPNNLFFYDGKFNAVPNVNVQHNFDPYNPALPIIGYAWAGGQWGNS